MTDANESTTTGGGKRRHRPAPNPTFEITHPNDPSIIVQARRTTEAENLEAAEEMRKSRRRIAVVDPRTNDLLVDKDGNTVTEDDIQLPRDYAVRYIKRTLVGWSGILDENDADIPFEEKNFGVLAEDWLDVYEAWPDDKPNKPAYPRRRSFAAYLGEVVRRPVSDPTTPRSA